MTRKGWSMQGRDGDHSRPQRAGNVPFVLPRVDKQELLQAIARQEIIGAMHETGCTAAEAVALARRFGAMECTDEQAAEFVTLIESEDA